MRVKNHMAMWFLWFLWFLSVECSSNPLYKPLCAFLVFVVLVWFLCGLICGFWSRVVFGSGLRVRSTSCGFCGSVVLPSMLDAYDCAPDPHHVVFVDRWSCASTRRRLMWFLWIGGLARPLSEGSCGFFFGSVVLRVHLPSMLAYRCWLVALWLMWSCIDVDARPLGACGLLKRFAHRLTSCYVPFRRHGGDLYKWRKRSWLERP